jgi:large subunit ribosomal protein L10
VGHALNRPAQVMISLDGAVVLFGRPFFRFQTASEVEMARPEKVEAVREITGRFNDADAALLTEYRGLRVGEIAELRRALRDAGAEYKVLKNTLARIAVREVGLEDLAPMLEGPTAIAFVSGDAAAAAKALDDAAKKFPVLEIKGGVLLGKIIDAAQAKRLAQLEPREVILAKVAMLANAPAQQTVNVFSALLRNFGSMLAQVVAKKESGELPGGAGEAPADTPAPEEVGQPREETPAADAAPEEETPGAEAAPAEVPEAVEQAEAAPESSAAAAVGGADTALGGAISPEAQAEEVETSGTEEEQ